MPTINPLVKKRLEAYPKDVVELATAAIELSARMKTEAAVEALKQKIRQIVRRGEEHDTP